jgi:hypothetical protein
MMNLPGGHQQSFTESTARSSPAADPTKEALEFLIGGDLSAVPGRWQEPRHNKITSAGRLVFMASPAKDQG